VPLREAEIDEQQHDQARAIDHYLRALELGERRTRTVQRLVQLLVDRRRFREADRILRKLEEHSPLPAELTRLASEIAVHTQNHERAVHLARQAVPAETRDFRNQLWLARILQTCGRDAEAEGILRRAVQQDPTIPDPWLALIQHLKSKGALAEAETAIKELREKLPCERLRPTLARCYEALGNIDEAEDHFLAALTSKPNDFMLLVALASFYLHYDQTQKAERHLRRLIDTKDQIPEETVAWARRQLALVVAAGGKPGSTEQALALIERNRASTGWNVADQRAKATVWAARPEHRQDAIRLFEESVRQQALRSDEQFRLAQLYEAEGDLSRAREQLLDLISTERANPGYLAYYTRFLLRQGEVHEAKLWLGRLEKLQPDAQRTLEMQVQLKAAKTTSPRH
jgi:predicted Zn-dependent protease